jgi:hypothetical protein
VGEARRHGSEHPTEFELARRWTNRLLDMYPQPIRGYLRLSLQLIAAFVLLAGGLLIVAGLVSFIEWLMGPPLYQAT